jgi:hypothetical protein
MAIPNSSSDNKVSPPTGEKPTNEPILTKRQLAKREQIIRGMKHNKPKLVSKYGKDAERVMIGRATNMAKKITEKMDRQRIRETIKSVLQQAPKSEIKEYFNPLDVTKLDIPLLIRIMEYAKEDAKTDMDLHTVAENIVELSKTGKTLTMADYNNIVNTSAKPAPEELDEASMWKKLAKEHLIKNLVNEVANKLK